MAPPHCPACGAATHEWQTVPCSEPALRWTHVTLRRCPACGTGVTVERPPAAAHEIGAYAPGTPRLHSLARPILDRFDAQRLRFLEPWARPQATLLDIGAGR